jgi:hypothetical protein
VRRASLLDGAGEPGDVVLDEERIQDATGSDPMSAPAISEPQWYDVAFHELRDDADGTVFTSDEEMNVRA